MAKGLHHETQKPPRTKSTSKITIIRSLAISPPSHSNPRNSTRHYHPGSTMRLKHLRTSLKPSGSCIAEIPPLSVKSADSARHYVVQPPFRALTTSRHFRSLHQPPTTLNSSVCISAQLPGFIHRFVSLHFTLFVLFHSPKSGTAHFSPF